MALDEATLVCVLREEFVRAERILISHDVDVIEALHTCLECLYGYLIHMILLLNL